MKKINYESPTVEVVDVRVEAGFQGSDGNNANYANGGIGVFGTVDEGDMGEFTGTDY